ncbi:hypothetical protein KH400_12685 [Desertibacillus haloalkaliphilus]|nr:hypothetical protein [Desertibacillus haloalkaliphilus]
MVNSEFSIEDHVEYVEKIQDERGLTKEEADEEALQKSQETREVLENEEAKNSKEAKASIQEEIEQLGISEDEYWEEYMLSNYAHVIMREKLMEYERNHNPARWNERQQEIIEEFKNRESQQIDEFKREIGMK